MGFEESFGTRWVVWIGGLALALGGFFLVRYAIEQGLIGPAMRVTLGAMLAAATIATGEWMRRNERHRGFAGPLEADIPSILTAVGTTIAYADIYAAYALYGILSAAAAFVLLGIVALATLAAALLHGPALAGLGLVGAYVTPLLVATGRADYWSLYLYLAVVTAAALALARIRLWTWLAATAVTFALLWTLPGVGELRVDSLNAHLFHVVTSFALSAALIVSDLLYGPPADDRSKSDPLSTGALAVFLIAAAVLVIASHEDGAALATFAALAAATCAFARRSRAVTLTVPIAAGVAAVVAVASSENSTALVIFVALEAAVCLFAWRAESITASVPVAAVLAVIVMAHWPFSPAAPVAGFAPESVFTQAWSHLVVGAGLALLFAFTGFLVQGRSEDPTVSMMWSASAVAAPLAILITLYYRIAGFDHSIPFATAALLLAALATAATESLNRRPPRPGLAASGAIFATGAVASLALALTMALERGWLTIGLALMVPGIAWIAQRRPLPALRWLAAITVGLVVARILWDPRIVGSDIGPMPIFNWLTYGYGVPTAAFWLAGHLLRRRADDEPTRIVETGAILFTVLLVGIEIRHIVNGGDVYRPTAQLAEVALQASVWLALAIGLERLRLRTRSIVHDVGALVLAVLALIGIVLGLLFNVNPLFTGEPVGGPFVNLIVLGYALPALLASTLALVSRATRPQHYSTVPAIAAVTLALLYFSLEVRRLYHGPILIIGPTSDAEQYTYSAIWLVFGVALLAAGIALRSQPVRFASAAVVILTVLKVFLVDMADPTGIYQALSFIGLGIVLLGIGWFYQRLLFRPHAVVT